MRNRGVQLGAAASPHPCVPVRRNALMFNFGFVFDSKCDTTSYKPVLRKLALFMRALETESEFLFNDAKRVRGPWRSVHAMG